MEDAQQFPTSAGYGADVINEAFNTYLASNSSEDKVKYDKAMLQCAGRGKGHLSSCIFSMFLFIFDDFERVSPLKKKLR